MPTNAEYEARIQTFGWDELLDLWKAIERRDTPDWDLGRAFEYLVLRAFQLDGAEVRWPYTVDLFGESVEQIDGALHSDGLSCLVECKDMHAGVSVLPIAKLRNQLLRRPAGTVGLMFSRSGFTDSARFLARFALPQAILFWSGREVQFALECRRIRELLVLKYRFCAEEGVPEYNVGEEGMRWPLMS